MKTGHRYISYRENRDCYQVTIKVDGKGITKTCKTLEDAIAQRNNLLAIYRLQDGETVDKKVPCFLDAFTNYMEHEVRDKVKRSTYAGYQLTLERFRKYFGNLRLTPSHEICGRRSLRRCRRLRNCPTSICTMMFAGSGICINTILIGTSFPRIPSESSCR